MIVTKPQVNIVSEGVQDSVQFGIKEAGLSHIFNVLRNQLYSNKILAVLREYSCNAVDSHTEAGVSRPIQVTLPSRLSLELKIRDFGTGLSDEQIKEVYAFYGESTKRASNKMIGQLGLGSKSGFSYGDNFVINSCFNGIKTIYNAYIDETQIGKIAKLASSPTTEGNGVEIVIPVKTDDVGTFVATAKDLFRYFVVKPEVKGVPNFYDVDEAEKSVVEHEGEGWSISEGRNNQSVFVMGNIGYIIGYKELVALKFNDEESDTLETLLRSREVRIDFEIGDLDIAASRESLQFTARTIEKIKVRLREIRKSVLAELQETISSCTSLWAMKQTLNPMFRGHSVYYILSTDASKSVFKFKGQQVNELSTLISYEKIEVETAIYSLRHAYRLGRHCVVGINNSNLNRTDSVSKHLLVENTKGLKSQVGNYLWATLDAGANDCRAVVFHASTKKARAEFLAKVGAIESDVVSLDSFTKLKYPNGRSSGSGSSKTSKPISKKHMTSAFTLDLSYQGHSTAKSSWYTPTNIDIDNTSPKTHCYVVLSRFVTLEGADGSRLQSLHNALKLLCDFAKIGHDALPTIIAVKQYSKEAQALVGSNVPTLNQFCCNLVNRMEDESNISVALRQHQHLLNFHDDDDGLLRIVRHILTGKIEVKGACPNLDRLLAEFALVVNPTEEMERVWFSIRNVTMFVTNTSSYFNAREIMKLKNERTSSFNSDLKNKYKVFGHAMRLTRAVSHYSSREEKTWEMISDYLQTRDHLLAGLWD